MYPNSHHSTQAHVTFNKKYMYTNKMESPICFGNVGSKVDPLIAPCNCKGGMKYVHKSCLLTSRINAPTFESDMVCDQCRSTYNFTQSWLCQRLLHFITVEPVSKEKARVLYRAAAPQRMGKKESLAAFHDYILEAIMQEANDIDTNISAVQMCPRSKATTCPHVSRVFVDTDIVSPKKVRILWTGWMMDTQWVSCLISDAMSEAGKRESMAIEQSMYPRFFIRTYGTWDQQLGMFQREFNKKYPKVNTVEDDFVEMRKNLWDEISRMWAADPRFEYTLAIVPPRESINPDGTLLTIELPNLHPETRLCFRVYDCKTRTLSSLDNISCSTVNPHTNVMSIGLAQDDFLDQIEARRSFDEWFALR